MNKGLELYVHIPFCVKKCDYCDFLSAPSDEKTKQKYLEALLAEILSYEGRTEGYHVTTIFIGGGTPSCVGNGYIEQILNAINRAFSISEKDKPKEITIEVNPGTLTKEKLQEYNRAGVNRLSFGLQSTNNRELKLLGRIHTFECFYENYMLARSLGFNNINIDLMSALPGQTSQSWESTLRRVALLEPEHISAYSLIIEEGTPFYDRFSTSLNNAEALPGEEADRIIYASTRSILEEYGYHRYEISNYARKGYECLHNLGYWTGAEYLGLGLGASSIIKRTRFRNVTRLEDYIELCTLSCKSTENATSKRLSDSYDNLITDAFHIRRDLESLNQARQMEEFMFLGLRITDGIRKTDFENLFNKSIDEIYYDKVKKLAELGLLIDKNGAICLTERGIDVSNVVLAEFLLD